MRSRRAKYVTLTQIEVHPSSEHPLPDAVVAFLSDAGARIDAFFELWSKSSNLGFVPSDYEAVYAVPKSIRESNPGVTRLCEWGSGFGVVVGLATILGYDAVGIEIDRRCVNESRSLLADHGLRGEILEGSFVPERYAVRHDVNTNGLGTILFGSRGIDEVDVEIEDFDLVYAFPWPDEQEMYSDLFARHAAVGAILVTYSALEGIRVKRKTRG